MMKLLQSLNFVGQCKKYRISLWQCPSFLFLIMGIIICLVAIISYLIGTRYITEPRIVALIVLVVCAILLILSFIITNSFEKLLEANRLKSEFINIVSHQLRAPLSNLSWAIELLMSGGLGRIEREQLDYFKILKENSDRMKDLVKDLLIVSKIDSAQLSLKKEEFSLEELTKEIIKEFEYFAKASNCQIEFFAKENLPKIFGDRYQLRQVIENLLDNAIRYTKEKGKVTIKIKKEKNSIRFEISDNGVGIPREDQKFIFQKFFRASNVLKHKTQGTGLGLYIAKEIIERSGGKIGFKSQEGVGSTFWFTLPIKS
jgi:signal transduction histidine kinase